MKIVDITVATTTGQTTWPPCKCLYWEEKCESKRAADVKKVLKTLSLSPVLSRHQSLHSDFNEPHRSSTKTHFDTELWFSSER